MDWSHFILSILSILSKLACLGAPGVLAVFFVCC
jgi:hypothetical protein